MRCPYLFLGMVTGLGVGGGEAKCCIGGAEPALVAQELAMGPELFVDAEGVLVSMCFEYGDSYPVGAVCDGPGNIPFNGPLTALLDMLLSMPFGIGP